MRIEDMRIALGLGADATDTEIVSLYGAWERDESERLAAAAAISTDPFAVALDAIFYAPGSEAAVYDDGQDDPREIRVIRSQPDEDKGYGAVRIVQPALTLSIRYSDVPKPVMDAAIIIGASLRDGFPTSGKAVLIDGDPIGDIEGLSFSCLVRIEV